MSVANHATNSESFGRSPGWGMKAMRRSALASMHPQFPRCFTLLHKAFGIDTRGYRLTCSPFSWNWRLGTRRRHSRSPQSRRRLMCSAEKRWMKQGSGCSATAAERPMRRARFAWAAQATLQTGHPGIDHNRFCWCLSCVAVTLATKNDMIA